MTQKMQHTIGCVVAASGLLGGLTGCIERRIEITTEPPGAKVFLNDEPVGLTPTDAVFLYHGVYDIRIEKDGYEPLITSSEAKAPIYENAPLDLIAQALPVKFKNIQRWHFVLTPSLESTLSKADMESQLLDRAAAMRDKLAGERTDVTHAGNGDDED